MECNSEKMTELKSCPLCGGTAEMCKITIDTVTPNHRIPKNCVGCSSCKAWVIDGNLDDAIAIWNRMAIWNRRVKE